MRASGAIPRTPVAHMLPCSLQALARVPQVAVGHPPTTRSIRRVVSPAMTGRPWAVMPPSTTPTTIPAPR